MQEIKNVRGTGLLTTFPVWYKLSAGGVVIAKEFPLKK